MVKSEVKTKLALVKKAIAAIEENEDEAVAYSTANKHLPGHGYIHEMATIGALVKAHAEITKKSTNDLSASIKALNLSDDELPEEPVKILGFKPKTWFNDIQKRLDQIRTSTKLAKLKAAEATLSKHLSNDDKFEMDTDGIDSLLA
jgi:hypothetical protein